MGLVEKRTPATSPSGSKVRTGLRARLFAWSLGHADHTQHRLYADRKRALFTQIEGRAGSAPVVVEIGAGTGLNAAFLPTGARWVVVEPNVHFHGRIREAAQAHGLTVDLRDGAAELLPVADGEADAVVSTLVLCSVADVSRSLAEARRVLRPGGRFVFVEHVAAPPGSLLRRVQRFVRQPWGWLADGCRPDQDTGRRLAEAGFADLQMDAFRVSGGVVAPHIAGVATR